MFFPPDHYPKPGMQRTRTKKFFLQNFLPERIVAQLDNNVTVVRILDAARESARTGQTVVLE